MVKAVVEEQGWQLMQMATCYENPHLKVNLESVRSPARSGTACWTVVRRKAAVVIAPMTADGKLVLISQERIPIRRTIWEFPAGQIDEQGEHSESVIRQTALREMREECGYKLAEGGQLQPLGFFYSSPGFTDEHSYLFLANGVEPDERGYQHDEHETILRHELFSIPELLAMVADSTIFDANTLSTIARLLALGICQLPAQQ